MEYQQFERVKALITAASASQTIHLERLIDSIIAEQTTAIALAHRADRVIMVRTCPHCTSKNVVLHGMDANRRQRFKCRGCRRCYNTLTGTAMARARKPEKWSKYLGCMTDHLSIRKIIKTGIGIRPITALRWRHRFLKAAANDNTATLSGVVEVDETFFLRSFKGSRGWKRGEPPEQWGARPRAWGASKPGLSSEQVPVLTALDSGGGVYETILASLTGIEAALDGRIAAGSVLCSDGAHVYERVADAAGAEHRRVIVPTITPRSVKMNPVPTPPRGDRLGLGLVNAHHGRLKVFINMRCRGVATKYLANYLGWNRAMRRVGFVGGVLLDQALA